MGSSHGCARDAWRGADATGGECQCRGVEKGDWRGPTWPGFGEGSVPKSLDARSELGQGKGFRRVLSVRGERGGLPPAGRE